MTKKRASKSKSKHMPEVARLLKDMAETIEVCDKTLVIMDKAVQKQQRQHPGGRGAPQDAP